MRILYIFTIFLLIRCSTPQSTNNNLTLQQIEGEIQELLNDYKNNIEKNTVWDKEFYENLVLISNSFDSVRMSINDKQKSEIILNLEKLNKEKCLPMFQLDNSWISELDPNLTDIDFNINIAFNELNFLRKAIKVSFERTGNVFRRMTPLAIPKDSKQTDIYFTAFIDDQKTGIKFENEKHENINDTMKIVARYYEDHYTIINKQNTNVKSIFKIKKIDGTFDYYPIYFPTDK